MKPDEQFFIAERKLIINSARTGIISQHAFELPYHEGAEEQTRYMIYKCSGPCRTTALYSGILNSEFGSSLNQHLFPCRSYVRELDSYAFKYVDDAEQYLTNAINFVRWLHKQIKDAPTKKINKLKAKVSFYILTGEQWDTTDTAKMRASSNGLQGKRREDLKGFRRSLEDSKDLL